MKLVIAIAALCAALAVACSAQHQAASHSARPMVVSARQDREPIMATENPSVVVVGPSDPHHEIEQLAEEIDAERAKMKLEPVLPTITCANCPAPAVEPFAVTPNSEKDLTCRPAHNDTCSQSCTLSDSICSNADKICGLAKQLPGDKWAADKCTNNKATCESAHAKCCSCQ